MLMRTTPNSRDMAKLSEALGSLNLNVTDFEFGHLIEVEMKCPCCKSTRIRDEIHHFMIKEKPKTQSDSDKNKQMIPWRYLVKKDHGWELK